MEKRILCSAWVAIAVANASALIVGCGGNKETTVQATVPRKYIQNWPLCNINMGDSCFLEETALAVDANGKAWLKSSAPTYVAPPKLSDGCFEVFRTDKGYLVIGFRIKPINTDTIGRSRHGNEFSIPVSDIFFTERHPDEVIGDHLSFLLDHGKSITTTKMEAIVEAHQKSKK